jgi:hypothetical protein
MTHLPALLRLLYLFPSFTPSGPVCCLPVTSSAPTGLLYRRSYHCPPPPSPLAIIQSTSATLLLHRCPIQRCRPQFKSPTPPFSIANGPRTQLPHDPWLTVTALVQLGTTPVSNDSEMRVHDDDDGDNLRRCVLTIHI